MSAAGCYRGLDGEGGQDGDGDGGDDPAAEDPFEPPASCEGEVRPLALHTPRLTHHEYDNTLRDLLGPEHYTAIQSSVGQVPGDVGLAVLDRLSQDITFEHVKGYHEVAEDVGEYFEGDAAARAQLVPCLEAANDSGCITQFVEEFGARAYRRPLRPAEVEALVAQYEGGLEDGKGAGLRQVLATLLQAPAFVFRLELEGEPSPDDPEALTLTDHELAARLSYYLWGHPPDDVLWEAAQAGELGGGEGLRAQVDRMIDDPRTRANFGHFARQWLSLDSVPNVAAAPEYRAQGLDLSEVDAAIAQEIPDIIDHVAWELEGSFADLLQTPVAFPRDPAQAAVYGVSVSSDGAAVTLDDPARAGLLTRMAFLVGSEGKELPAKRGAYVFRQLLCGQMAPPDQEVFPDGELEPPALDGSETTRQVYETITADAACQGCHAVLNPSAFAMTDYDGLGRARTLEQVFDEAGTLLGELPIDARVQIAGLGGDPVDVDGAAQLSAVLASSNVAKQCLATRWFQYTTSRDPSTDDACFIDSQTEAVGIEQGGLRELVMWLTDKPQFRQRRQGQ